MAKTKTPLFSLGSRGRLADTIVTQKSGSQTIIRKKPIPTYRRTLPQYYQRILFEYYKNIWLQLSAAQKRLWEAYATGYHMSGYAYFMKFRLTDLPDIALMYYLDYAIGADIPDTSRNANTGTNIGSTLADGIIDHARHFDGSDDWVSVPESPSLIIPSTITIEAFIRPHGTAHGTIAARPFYNRGYQFHFQTDWVTMLIRDTAGGTAYMYSEHDINIDQWHHVAGTYDGTDQTGIHCYIDGQLSDRQLVGACSGNIENIAGWPLRVGGKSKWYHGLIDHLIIYNRVLDAAEIKLHSERSYP